MKRRFLLTEKYDILLDLIEKNNPKLFLLFPSLDTVDLSDLIYLINLTFNTCKSRESYILKIDELMKEKFNENLDIGNIVDEIITFIEIVKCI